MPRWTGTTPARTAARSPAARFPELVPVLEELRRDQRLVDDSLRRLRTLVDALGQGADPLAVRTELDSLAALMETHFRYKEKKIVSALDALDVPAWEGSVPDFLRTDDPDPDGSS